MRALLKAITPGFRDVVADGTTNEMGGIYDGAESMLGECQTRVCAIVDVRPVPAEYPPVSAGRARFSVSATTSDLVSEWQGVPSTGHGKPPGHSDVGVARFRRSAAGADDSVASSLLPRWPEGV